MPVNYETCCESINESVRQRRILLCCVFWALIFIAFAIRAIKYYQYSSASSSSSNETWDYLVFAQQWPISACSVMQDKNQMQECRLSENNNNWTIHGIWPNRYSNSLQYCLSTPFNITELVPIQEELTESWPSALKSVSPSSFWNYQWMKHGTCGVHTERLNTQLKYFKQGLEWNKQYNITKALDQCGIHPDNLKILKSTHIMDCLKKHFDVDPQTICNFDKVRKKSVLHEVRFCIDKNLIVQSCKVFRAQKLCKGDFIYPASLAPPL